MALELGPRPAGAFVETSLVYGQKTSRGRHGEQRQDSRGVTHSRLTSSDDVVRKQAVEEASSLLSSLPASPLPHRNQKLFSCWVPSGAPADVAVPSPLLGAPGPTPLFLASNSHPLSAWTHRQPITLRGPARSGLLSVVSRPSGRMILLFPRPRDTGTFDSGPFLVVIVSPASF